MTSTKKWLIIFIIVLICGGGVLFSLSLHNERNTTELTGLWKLIDEKLPKSPMLRRYQDFMKWEIIEQQSTTSLTFSLHPSLFSIHYTTGEHLLSGSSSAIITTIYDTVHQEGVISGSLNLQVLGIIEQGAQENSTIEDTQLQGDDHNDILAHSFDFSVSRQAKILHDDVYIYLDRIDFSADQEGGLTVIRQRYLLLNQYKQKRVHFSRDDIPLISAFLPDALFRMINENDQKTRIIPDQNNGRTFLLSGENLVISGDATAGIGEDTLSINFPHHNLSLEFGESHVPNIVDVHVQQTNDYRGSLDGTLELANTRKKHAFAMEGALLFPGGVWGKVEQSLLQKKGKLLPHEITIPEESLEWSTISFQPKMSYRRTRYQIG